MTAQFPQNYGGQPYYPQNPGIPGLPPGPLQPKPKRRWPWIVAGIVAFIFIVGACNAAARSSTSPPYYGPAGKTSTAAAPTVAAQKPPSGPLTQFGDGTYEVGVDVAAGRYKTPGPDAGDLIPNCYWARRTDDGGSLRSIIANKNLSGPGSVTIKAGEFIEVTGGCNWTKQ